MYLILESKKTILVEWKEVEEWLQYHEMFYTPDQTAFKLHFIKQHHNFQWQVTLEEQKFSNFFLTDCTGQSWDSKLINSSITTTLVWEATLYTTRLRSLPLLSQTWENLFMDFITVLPFSYAYNTIFKVVDRLTKMTTLVSCDTTAGRQEVSVMLLTHVWILCDLIDTIVCDWGFWSAFDHRK